MQKLSLLGALLSGLLVACGHSQVASGPAAGPREDDGMLRDWSAAAVSPKAEPKAVHVAAATKQDLSAAMGAEDADAPASATPLTPVRAEVSNPPEPSNDEAAAVAAAPATLEVRIKAKSKGRAQRCSVAVGGRKLGRAPIAAVKVPAGRHRLQVTCSDRREFSDTITLDAGEHEQLVLGSADLRRRGVKRQARR